MFGVHDQVPIVRSAHGNALRHMIATRNHESDWPLFNVADHTADDDKHEGDRPDDGCYLGCGLRIRGIRLRRRYRALVWEVLRWCIVERRNLFRTHPER